METELLFQKALYLLDKNQNSKAEEILLKLVEDQSTDSLIIIRALCVLGDMYYQLKDFSKAKTYLDKVINLTANYSEPDLIDYERSRALEIFKEIAG